MLGVVILPALSLIRLCTLLRVARINVLDGVNMAWRVEVLKLPT